MWMDGDEAEIISDFDDTWISQAYGHATIRDTPPRARGGGDINATYIRYTGKCLLDF